MYRNKTAYICSRYTADTQGVFEDRLQTTKDISRVLVTKGYDVIVPHLYYPLFLDDTIKAERNLGMASAIRLLKVCDVVFAHTGNGVSAGMEAELEVAREKGKVIHYFKHLVELRQLIKE